MKADHHGNAFPLRRWLAAAALAGLSLSAAAGGTITKDARGFGTTYTTGVYRYDAATNLPSIPQTASTTATGGANSGTITINGRPDGHPQASTASKVPVPGSGGREVPVEARAKIPKAAAGAAIAKFGAKVLFPLNLGMAAYDLYKDLGFEWQAGDPANGTDNSWIKNTNTPTWLVSSNYFANVAAEGPPSAACEAGRAAWASVNPVNWKNFQIASVGTPDQWNQFTCTYTYQSAPFWNTTTATASVVAGPPHVTSTPATEQQVADAIASQSGWPGTASRALADAIQAGQTVPHETPEVSGPASVPGPTTTKQEPATKYNPDGTVAKDANGNAITGTKTTTTTTNYTNTYNNNELRITTNTTNTYTYNYSDGTTKTETDSTDQESPAPEEHKDPCEANPERVGCKELGEVPSEEVPKSTKTVEYVTEDMGWGGGSCPAPFGWSDSLGSHAINLAPFCEKVETVVRPLVLLLAALAALAIALPAIKE